MTANNLDEAKRQWLIWALRAGVFGAAGWVVNSRGQTSAAEQRWGDGVQSSV